MWFALHSVPTDLPFWVVETLICLPRPTLSSQITALPSLFPTWVDADRYRTNHDV